jgi:lipoprotein-anchoring transpeptidase ErfK/SrfK
VKVDGPWSLVLTPSRQQLPSKDNGNAPAQTAGWVRTSALVKNYALPQHLVVSVSKQTISIVDASGKVSASYPAGVGTSTAPTPTDVVGYLQARYLDPSQDEAVHPIQLTSLHSSSADEPYLGHDGGLIGVHYNATATGNVSHGCVRLDVAAIDAVNALPLGTLITLVP